MAEKEQELYPKSRQRPEPDHSDRSWGVSYHLVYDDGLGAWTQYYHTKLGARISAFLHYHIRSWGGRATLFDNRKEQYYG